MYQQYFQFPLAHVLEDPAGERRVERRVFKGATQKTQEVINNAGNHAGYRPGMTCRGCHFEAFWMILQAFWHPQLAKSGLKDAPQRRGYTRSRSMGPIDGSKHWCPQKQYVHFPPERLQERLSCRKTCLRGCDPENTENDQKCRKSCRIPSRNDMPRSTRRSDGDTPARSQWVPSMAAFSALCQSCLQRAATATLHLRMQNEEGWVTAFKWGNGNTAFYMLDSLCDTTQISIGNIVVSVPHFVGIGERVAGDCDGVAGRYGDTVGAAVRVRTRGRERVAGDCDGVPGRYGDTVGAAVVAVGAAVVTTVRTHVPLVQWQMLAIQAFWHPKLAKSDLKDAPQRRGYTRSRTMGPIAGRKTCLRGCDPENTGNAQKCRKSCRIPSRNDMPR
eukprot:gene22397-biopygen5742